MYLYLYFGHADFCLRVNSKKAPHQRLGSRPRKNHRLSNTIAHHLMDPSPVDMFSIGALAGIVMHLCVFIHGEWHIQAPSIFLGHVLVPLAPLIGSIYYGLLKSTNMVQKTATTALGYCTALFLSIVVYRVFFPPAHSSWILRSDLRTHHEIVACVGV